MLRFLLFGWAPEDRQLVRDYIAVIKELLDFLREERQQRIDVLAGLLNGANSALASSEANLSSAESKFPKKGESKNG